MRRQFAMNPMFHRTIMRKSITLHRYSYDETSLRLV